MSVAIFLVSANAKEQENCYIKNNLDFKRKHYSILKIKLNKHTDVNKTKMMNI